MKEIRVISLWRSANNTLNLLPLSPLPLFPLSEQISSEICINMQLESFNCGSEQRCWLVFLLLKNSLKLIFLLLSTLCLKQKVVPCYAVQIYAWTGVGVPVFTLLWISCQELTKSRIFFQKLFFLSTRHVAWLKQLCCFLLTKEDAVTLSSLLTSQAAPPPYFSHCHVRPASPTISSLSGRLSVDRPQKFRAPESPL